MSLVYKLTDSNWETYNHTKWGPGVTHVADGFGELCGSGWLHFYTDPRLAIIFNLIHASYINPVLWEAEANIEKNDRGIKFGTRKLTTVKIIEIPDINIINKIAFGILCTKEVYKQKNWNIWADNWLNNVDRSSKAGSAAACNASNAASYAADAVAYYAAADAANTAYYVANTAYYAAADAAYYAAKAADAANTDGANIAIAQAADAASCATYARNWPNYIEIIEKAMLIK